MSIMASETCPLSCYAGENQTQTKKKNSRSNCSCKRLIFIDIGIHFTVIKKCVLSGFKPLTKLKASNKQLFVTSE